MTIKITRGAVVLRRVSGVALLTEDDFSTINSEFAPIKTLELGAYTLTKEKGYSLTYPSFGGEWVCTVKE